MIGSSIIQFTKLAILESETSVENTLIFRSINKKYLKRSQVQSLSANALFLF